MVVYSGKAALFCSIVPPRNGDHVQKGLVVHDVEEAKIFVAEGRYGHCCRQNWAPLVHVSKGEDILQMYCLCSKKTRGRGRLGVAGQAALGRRPRAGTDVYQIPQVSHFELKVF